MRVAETLVVACSLFLLLADACGPGRGVGRFRNPRRRLTPLVFKQHVPNVSEHAVQASSIPEGRVTRNDPRFRHLVPNYNADIIFKDEEGTGADRLMTQRCKERLNTLAISVMNQWPGVRLRVTEGWDEEGYHPADSLHYEGRAVDVTTSDRDRSKYGMLARLAVEAGFDWVFYESRSHIHCSVKSESSQASKYGGCFAGNTTVTTSSGEKKKLKDLRIGDEILAVDSSGKFKYSRVLMFLDRNPTQQRVFVQLTTSKGKQLHLTPAHLLLVKARATNKTEVLFAERLQVGDRIFIKDNERIDVDIVTHVTAVMDTGVYAPLTEEGTIVVDDIVASCFAVINSQKIAQWAFTPVRIYAHVKSGWFKLMHTVGMYTSEDMSRSALPSSLGTHWYARVLYDIAYYIFPSDMLLK